MPDPLQAVHLPSPLTIATRVALAAAVLAGCADTDAPTAAPAAVASGPTSEALRAERADRPDPTTTTTSTTTTTTAPPPPPTTVAPAPPAPSPPAPAVAAAAAPAPPPPPPPPPPVANGGDEARALQLVNQARAAQGLPALRVSGGAQGVARAWSGHMAGAGLSHNPDLGGDLSRAGVAWRAIAENVGYGGSVDAVHGMFMGSSGHRNNILNPAYSQIGVGVVRQGGTVWVTLVFVGT